MNKLLGLMMTGGLLLGHASTTKAQITIQPGRGGSPSITLGQPAYGPQYAQPNYAQPGYAQPYRPSYTQPGYAQPYQPSYTQPGYAQPYQPSYTQPGYAQPYPQGTYSSGYSRYYNPGASPNQTYSYPNTPAPGYSVPYRQQSGFNNNGYYPNGQPYAPQGTGVIINGRTFTLPR